MLTCLLLGLVASHVTLFIARRGVDGRGALLAYCSGLAATMTLAAGILLVGEFEPLDAKLTLIKGVFFGLSLPLYGLWMAKNARGRAGKELVRCCGASFETQQACF